MEFHCRKPQIRYNLSCPDKPGKPDKRYKMISNFLSGDPKGICIKILKSLSRELKGKFGEFVYVGFMNYPEVNDTPMVRVTNCFGTLCCMYFNRDMRLVIVNGRFFRNNKIDVFLDLYNQDEFDIDNIISIVKDFIDD
jgi:hypothetical protein